jgi:hypothetical protein
VKWLLDNYRWFIPLLYGGLMLLTLVRWAFAERRHRREQQQIRRFIERVKNR